MQLALSRVGAGVVDVEEDHSRDGDAVHDGGRHQKRDQPAAAVSFFVVTEKVQLH